jgi:hypothetical protein
MTIQAYQFAGGQGFQPVPNLSVISVRAPTTSDRISAQGNPYQIGQYWQNTSTGNVYFYAGGGVWDLLSSSTSGPVDTLTGNSGGAIGPTGGNISILGSGDLAFAGSGSTLTGTITPGTSLISTITGDSGGALSPTAGNFNIKGTANQITVTGAGSTETLSVPATFIAPGSIAAITTVTATLGNITATNGNFVASTAGNGVVLPVNTGSGAASGTVNCNGRQGAVTFTGVSIAGGAALALTLGNTSITGAATQIIYTLTGATTGSALTIQSVSNSANTSVITVVNGTGLTTSIANITLFFILMN